MSTSSLDELHRTALSWLDEHCSLPVLRPSEWGLPAGGAGPRGLSPGRSRRKPRPRPGWSAHTRGRRVRPCGGAPRLGFLPSPCVCLMIRSNSCLLSAHSSPGLISGVFRYTFMFSSSNKDQSCVFRSQEQAGTAQGVPHSPVGWQIGLGHHLKGRGVSVQTSAERLPWGSCPSCFGGALRIAPQGVHV